MAQRSPKIGSLPWEDEATEQSRLRRVQQVSPRSGRTLPGMPVEMADAEEEDLPRRRRFETPSGPWYRPSTKLGRVLLGSGALLVIGAVTTGVLATRNMLERDGRFRIGGTDNIQVAGLSEVSRADILPVFGEDIGRNIFFIHLSERRKQLERIPWIQKATVMRLLPDQIQVSVVERTPIAFVREGQRIELVDADGVVLSMSPTVMTLHHYSFPVVTGIDPKDAPASRKARMAVYQRLISDLDSTGQHVSRQISEVDLTDSEDARVLMQDDPTLLHFGDEQFLVRYQRYKAHIAEWRQQYPRLSAVDLRYDSQVVLRMAGPPDAAPTAVNADDGKAEASVTASPSAVTSKPPAAVLYSSQAVDAPQPKTPAKPGRNAASAHKSQPHHAARPTAKSTVERERQRREAAKAAMLRWQRQHTSATANGQGQ